MKKKMPSDYLKSTLLRKGKVNEDVNWNQEKSASISHSVFLRMQGLQSLGLLHILRSWMKLFQFQIVIQIGFRSIVILAELVISTGFRLSGLKLPKPVKGCTVVVKPGQGWTTGHSLPVQAFEGFRVIDDTEYYIGRGRGG